MQVNCFIDHLILLFRLKFAWLWIHRFGLECQSSQLSRHPNAKQPENSHKKTTNLVLSVNNPVSEDTITRENISCFTSCASPISMTQRINMMVKCHEHNVKWSLLAFKVVVERFPWGSTLCHQFRSSVYNEKQNL